MEKILKEWKEFVAEANRVKIYSTETKIAIKRQEGSESIIEDTLALIRGIPSITVVNSDTDQEGSDASKILVDIEFKFVPRSSSLVSDLKAIKKEILKAQQGATLLTLKELTPVRMMKNPFFQKIQTLCIIIEEILVNFVIRCIHTVSIIFLY